jgi:hypothetical protein
MKIAERIVIVLLLLFLIGGGAWIYFAVKHNQKEVREAVARGEYEMPKEKAQVEVRREDWRSIYPVTVPITIGTASLEASVAESMTQRIKGLSGTPFLPDNVVKLFTFGTSGSHSIWMKDMNYPLDIIWAAQDGTIVHIEEDVSPDSFPKSFASPVPAWFVIEANAGFVASSSISLGDAVVVK